MSDSNIKHLMLAASDVSISELKSNRKYMSVSMRMFSTRANLNKCAVTEAFIDDIIANKSDYVCMGLYADIAKLKSKDYRGLTHLFDRKTNSLMAEQIGSFYDFEKVSDEFGTSLIGYARICKRSEKVTSAIQELYDSNALNFSFEITAGAVRIEDDITIVDVNPENELTGMAVVSVPAYPESKALALVAELVDGDEIAKTQLSEMEQETVRWKFEAALYEKIGDCAWCVRPILFCHDCVIMYDSAVGKSFKAEYVVEGDAVIIKDFYEIAYVRAEEKKDTMDIKENENMNQNISENAEQQVEVAEVVEEVVQNEEIVSEPKESTVETAEATVEDTVEAEPVVAQSESKNEPEKEIAEQETSEQEDAECGKKEDAECGKKEEAELDLESELEAAKKRCAELEALVAELQPYKEEVERIREEKRIAELQEKRDQMTQYATNNGLDTKDTKVAEAIEKLDYEALFAEVMSKPKKVEKKDNSIIAGYTGMSYSGYMYLCETRKGKK